MLYRESLRPFKSWGALLRKRGFANWHGIKSNLSHIHQNSTSLFSSTYSSTFDFKAGFVVPFFVVAGNTQRGVESKEPCRLREVAFSCSLLYGWTGRMGPRLDWTDFFHFSLFFTTLLALRNKDNRQQQETTTIEINLIETKFDCSKERRIIQRDPLCVCG